MSQTLGLSLKQTLTWCFCQDFEGVQSNFPLWFEYKRHYASVNRLGLPHRLYGVQVQQCKKKRFANTGNVNMGHEVQKKDVLNYLGSVLHKGTDVEVYVIQRIRAD